MNKAAGEGKEPEEREENRDCSNYFGIDEAFLVPVADISDGVEVFTGDTDNDGGKGELREYISMEVDICRWCTWLGGRVSRAQDLTSPMRRAIEAMRSRTILYHCLSLVYLVVER